MKIHRKILIFALFLWLFTADALATAAPSKWLRLDADSKDRIRSLIKSDVESRTGFSTLEEDQINTSAVEVEREKESAAYKTAIEATSNEFRRAKKRSDDLTAQFQTMAYDYEESSKNVDTIKAGITNIDNQLERYRKDIRLQQKSLEKSLKTTKLGEAIVAVIYTRGFMDSAHKLERLADQASAPLIADHMGTYIKSFTGVINNVLSKDFIRAVQEGTAKWDRKEPFLLALSKGSNGTTYLRIKRYELYPFQAPEKGRIKPSQKNHKAKTSIITSIEDLKAFLNQNALSTADQNLNTVARMIDDSKQVNKQAKANQREQLLSFRERMDYLEKKIVTAETDRQSMSMMYKEKEARLEKVKEELGILRLKKESAELAFQNAHAALIEKKRVHESIIIKSSVVIVKRSETPAKASSEAVIEELRDVLNDARLQHFSSTTDVVNGKLVAESDDQAITKANIIAVRPLSFINEGDSIRVKIAFRVRTILDAKNNIASTPKRKTPPKSNPKAGIAVTQKIKAPPPTPPEPEQAVERPRPKENRPLSATKTPMKTLKKKPTQKVQSIPTRTAVQPRLSAEAMDFRFELKNISNNGNNLIVQVASTNKAEYIQYLAVYDRHSRYERSSITGPKIKPKAVHQVYLHQGAKRTASKDAFRGIPVKPGKTVLVEMIFKPEPSAKPLLSKLNLIPLVGTRSFIRTYSWRSEEIPFKNIRIP